MLSDHPRHASPRTACSAAIGSSSRSRAAPIRWRCCTRCGRLRDRLGLTLEVAGVDHGLRADGGARSWRSCARAPRRSGLPFVGGERSTSRRRAGAAACLAGRCAPGAAAGAGSAGRGARRATGWRSGTRPTTRPRPSFSASCAARGCRSGGHSVPARRRSSVRCSTCRARRDPPLPPAAQHPVRRGSLQRRPAVRAGSRSGTVICPRWPRRTRGSPRRCVALAAAAARRRGRRHVRPGPGAGPSLSRRAAAVVDRLRARGGTAAGRRRGRPAGRGLLRRAYASAPRAMLRTSTPPSAPTARSAGRGPTAGPDRHAWSSRKLSGGARGRPGRRPLNSTPICSRGRSSRASRRPGDRMRPRGGRGSRKLSDLMIDAKIARATRGRAAGRHHRRAASCCSFPGLRPAETARPTARTSAHRNHRFRPRGDCRTTSDVEGKECLTLPVWRQYFRGPSSAPSKGTLRAPKS